MMAKIGQKEQALRDLQAKKLSRAHEMMLEDGCPPKCLRTGPGPKLKPARPPNDGVTLAPPISVQKAIAADLADNEIETTNASAPPVADQQEDDMTKKNRATKKTAKPKKPAKVFKPKVASAPKEKTNGTSKKATVIGMLQSAEGATMDALTKATGWTPHSVHGLIGGLRAKSKMKITATKDGEGPNVYRIET